MTKSNERPLGEIIREVLKYHRLDDKVTETRLMLSWDKLMGNHIARYTVRLVLQGSHLTVYLRSSVLRNELGYAKTKIIDMINQELGETIVREISFR